MESLIASCRVQPISRRRSGTGTVATMSLEITARRLCSSRRPTAQAFVAITTRSAVTTPSGVCSTAGERRSSFVTFVPSWMRTPSSSATRRSPRTSSAGWRIAAEGSNMPAMWRSDPLRSAVCSGVHSSNGITPSSRQVAITPSQAPSWACDVAVQRCPPRWNCASMPCSLQNSPISSTAESAACAMASPPSRPHSSTRVPSLAHHEIAKPPLRPLAPPPQMSCSSTTTSHEGSRCLIRIAVQRPA